MVDRLLEFAEGTRLYILAPIVRGRKGEYRKEILEMQKAGFQRIKVDGTLYNLENAPLYKKKTHDIEVVVDRVVMHPDLGARLADALETTLKLTNGLAVIEKVTGGERTLFSSLFYCPVSGFTVEGLVPRLFSFNNPFGACPSCDGLGVNLIFDPRKVVPHPSLSLEEGAIAPWLGPFSSYYMQVLKGLARHYMFALKVPFQNLSEKVKKIILYGSGRETIPLALADRSRVLKSKKPFERVIPSLQCRWKEQEKAGKNSGKALLSK